MAYTECIKNYERIRSYLQEFYIYGFKSRDDYSRKSGRSYDNERRRLESYLAEYVHTNQTSHKKTVYLSMNSRNSSGNPFYRTLRAKSFTDRDITLHFLLLDILHTPELFLSFQEILSQLDAVLGRFSEAAVFDASTVRKKLQEYVTIGLLVCQKQGKEMIYNRSDANAALLSDSRWKAAIAFFSEAASCGVVGNFLSESQTTLPFSFKHHYLNRALDSEVLYAILAALAEHQRIVLQYQSRRGKQKSQHTVLPLKILVSSQNGRQSLLGYHFQQRAIRVYRLDYIHNVAPGEVCADFAVYMQRFEHMRSHLWGVSLPDTRRLERVSFTVAFSHEETYIYTRMCREKRCGIVERLDQNHCRFTAEVYDSVEMLPWIRTFLCRITKLEFSNPLIAKQFHADVKAMYRLYGIEENTDAVS